MLLFNYIGVGPDWARVGTCDTDRGVHYDLTVRDDEIDESQYGCEGNFLLRLACEKESLLEENPNAIILVSPLSKNEHGLLKVFYQLQTFGTPETSFRYVDLGAFWEPEDQRDFDVLISQIGRLILHLSKPLNLEHF